ncbi:hypothetical protein LC605_18685, partial [Nostoc sp. CHAB 5836]|uniref:hypothetical protein n=1 Tax=Nostoc sp. CHAB 5836 TaxID=2780404 RepID=UPI001E5F0B5E
PYGSRWMPLTSALGYSTFICAKKILSVSGLFIFKPDKSIQDGRETVKWMVQNLHGSRMKEFWEKANAEKQELSAEKRELSAGSVKIDAEKRELSAGSEKIDAGSEEIDALYRASISQKTQSEQELCETSRTPQEHLTNSSIEFVRCVRDTLAENPRHEETAIAPLGGAISSPVQGVSEIEVDLPTAMDCTTRPRVDAVPIQEDTFSAAPVAQNELSSKEALAFNVPCVSGRVGTDSTEIVPNLEKWSDEAIATRSNMRPQRMHQLQIAASSGHNPGFNFLLEWWNDDPVLMFMIKKLLVKYPHWGIVLVDGVLVNREG